MELVTQFSKLKLEKVRPSHHYDPGSILGSYVGCDWLIAISRVFLRVLKIVGERDEHISHEPLGRLGNHS